MNPAFLELLARIEPQFKEERSHDLQWILDRITQDRILQQNASSRSARTDRAWKYVQWPQFEIAPQSIRLMNQFEITESELIDEINRQFTPLQLQRLESILSEIMATWTTDYQHWTYISLFNREATIRSLLLHRITPSEVDCELKKRNFTPPPPPPPPPVQISLPEIPPGGGPDLHPVGVPRRPLPYSGGSEIALPLPRHKADEDI